MSDWLTIDQVLGGGPFREIGQPTAVAGPHADLIAVGGHLGTPQWMGHDLQSRALPTRARRPSDPVGPGAWHRFGVFRTDDLQCIHLVASQTPIHTIAFHPALPLVVFGAGTYDGGWSYDGTLTLLDLSTGEARSLLDESREVLTAHWSSATTLALVLASRTDEEIELTGTEAVELKVDSDDWAQVPAGGIHVREAASAPTDRPADQDPVAIETEVHNAAFSSGRDWTLRRLVWGVAMLRDGGCLATLAGKALERWSAEGTVVWSVPTAGVGCQVLVDALESSALVNVQHRPSQWPPIWPPSQVDRVDLRGGSCLPAIEPTSTVLLVHRSDGSWAARDSNSRSDRSGAATVLNGGDEVIAEVDIGGYDLFNHFFSVKNAPELFALQGTGQRPHEQKWIVEIHSGADANGSIRPLFPLEWDASRDGHFFGGPGAFVRDSAGEAIVHAGAVHDGRGLLPGNSFVVRRRYPYGELAWEFRADAQATDLDERDGIVLITYNTGELVALRTVDGELLGRATLRVGAHGVIPLSVSAGESGRVAVGTLDGRVLIALVEPTKF